MTGKRSRDGWITSVQNDLSERELSGEEARKTELNGGVS